MLCLIENFSNVSNQSVKNQNFMEVQVNFYSLWPPRRQKLISLMFMVPKFHTQKLPDKNWPENYCWKSRECSQMLKYRYRWDIDKNTSFSLSLYLLFYWSVQNRARKTKLAPEWHLTNSGGVEPSVVGAGVVLIQLGGSHVVLVWWPTHTIYERKRKKL